MVGQVSKSLDSPLFILFSCYHLISTTCNINSYLLTLGLIYLVIDWMNNLFFHIFNCHSWVYLNTCTVIWPGGGHIKFQMYCINIYLSIIVYTYSSPFEFDIFNYWLYTIWTESLSFIAAWYVPDIWLGRVLVQFSNNSICILHLPS